MAVVYTMQRERASKAVKVTAETLTNRERMPSSWERSLSVKSIYTVAPIG